MITLYKAKGRWRCKSNGRVVNARKWWDAINQVKCMNHALRMKEKKDGP